MCNTCVRSAWSFILLLSAGCADLFNLEPVPDARIADSTVPDAVFDPGCSDGTREGFIGAPDIAACGGAWSLGGLRGVTPGCNRAAGNSGSNPDGLECSAADLCAPGWEVCQTRFDVMLRSPTQGCAGLLPMTDTFFATAQSGGGAGECVDQGSGNTDDKDDLFGCGTMGLAVTSPTCAPLERNSGNECFSLPVGGWTCPVFNMEVTSVTKTFPHTGGGVLCCREPT